MSDDTAITPAAPAPFAEALARTAEEGAAIEVNTTGVQASVAKDLGRGWTVAAAARKGWRTGWEAAAALRWRPKRDR